MNCVICNDTCDKYDGKEWITLKNDNYFGRYHPTIHYCSYLCYQRTKHHLPKNHWEHVLNKTDFDDLRPTLISYKEKSFEYITYTEYIRLTDKEKEDYDSEKEINQSMDREKCMFYNDIYEEDKRTSMIEAEGSASDGADDDY